MSDTDKGDGVICLDSEEDGTPTKKKETVKQKKLKDSAPKPEQKTADCTQWSCVSALNGDSSKEFLIGKARRAGEDLFLCTICRQ